jgi:predicted MPP superfamily phosphohydrolase
MGYNTEFQNNNTELEEILRMANELPDAGGYGDIPTYHYVESGRVIDNIRTFKASHPNSLIFGAVSDIHVYNGDATYEAKSKASIKHASFALEMVGAMTECDFIANLGDNCWENGIDTDNALWGARYSINALKPAFDRLISFNLVGNHDKSDYTEAQYNLIGVHNDFDVASATTIRSFGYKDYTNKKVRVIVLNTCDYLNVSGGCALSYEQKDFLMRALDLSAKSDCAEWQILLLSHIPLDWNGGDYNYYTDLQIVLNAYEDGTTASITVNSSYAKNETPSNYATYSNGKLVYDYSGKNSAKIIANIHGHVHTNKVSKVANTNIARVATVNANPDLNKTDSYPEYGDYSITSTEANKIKKVVGTAKDTAATFYCLDLDEQIIYAFGYGADIDRTIIYKDVTTYSVTYNLTNCTSSNMVTVVVEGSSYATNIDPTDEDGVITNVVVTMNGVDISNKYNAGHLGIPEVTGNIVITAVASVPLWTETISGGDIAVATRSVWQLSGSIPALVNSNTEAAIGVNTPNAYSYTDRESKTVYLMPVNVRACDVALTNNDGSSCTYKFIGLKDNGGTFAVVFDTGKKSATTYTWTAGAIDYILISMEHTDLSNFAWGYDDTQISVTFTNGGTESGGDSGDDGSGNGGGDSGTTTYTNIIDTVGTVDNVRLRSGGATGDAAGFASNYFPVKAGDIIRVYFPNGNRASIPSNGVYCCLYSNTNGTLVAACDGSTSSAVLKNVTDKGYEIYIPADTVCSYARVAGGPNGAYDGWIVTVNEEIN